MISNDFRTAASRAATTLLAFFVLFAVAGVSRAQEHCESGWVWREAFAGDYVCVHPNVRARVWQDNEAASDRYAPGAYGPDTCRTGFVWRETGPDDYVCVPPESRDLVRAENRDNRRIEAPITSPRPLRGRCMDGYVERRAHPKDNTCVLPEARARVLEENSLAASRKGSDVCLPGFVWREASPSDLVCVEPSQRDQARDDNVRTNQRVLSGICATYAEGAVAQFNDMTARNCSLSGILWSQDRDWHFQRCFVSSANGRNREADERNAALRACAATAVPQKPVPPGESCLVSVAVRNVACLNHDGTPSSLSEGGSLAVGCGETVENARARARAGFASQFGNIAEDEVPTEPGSCTVTEQVFAGCHCP